MAQELKNRFVIDNEEYQFAVDDTPIMGSDAFIMSGAVFDWVTTMTRFGGRNINDSELVGESTDIPSSGVVYAAVIKKADKNTNTDHLSTDVPHRVIVGLTNSKSNTSTDSKKGNTYLYNNGTEFVFYNSGGLAYTEYPKKGVLYFFNFSNTTLEITPGLYMWSGSAFEKLTIS